MNLFQINGRAVGGTYAAPLLLGISKRSLVAGAGSSPAYAAWSGWHADTMFSLVPVKTQVTPFFSHVNVSGNDLLGFPDQILLP